MATELLQSLETRPCNGVEEPSQLLQVSTVSGVQLQLLRRWDSSVSASPSAETNLIHCM